MSRVMRRTSAPPPESPWFIALRVAIALVAAMVILTVAVLRNSGPQGLQNLWVAFSDSSGSQDLLGHYPTAIPVQPGPYQNAPTATTASGTKATPNPSGGNPGGGNPGGGNQPTPTTAPNPGNQGGGGTNPPNNPPVVPVAGIGDGFTLPAMGWNHYNHFGNTVNEATIRQVIDAMASNGMLAAGYHFVNLDDSWQGNRDGNGNLQANGNYPSGIKALADYAHSKGFKFGIYTTPGSTSCGGNTGSRNHIQQDVNEFAAWGVDYLKLDICTDAWGDDIRNDVHQFEQAIKATGRPMVFSLSSGGADNPWDWAAQEGLNSYRVGDDICQAWVVTNRDDNRFCYRPPNGGVYTIIEGQDGSHLAGAAGGTGSGHVPDPDMLEVGNQGLTFDEAKTHFSIWAISSAILIAGNDPRNLDDGTKSILENQEVIAIDQDPMVKQGLKVSSNNGVEVWTKDLADGGHVVLLFNTNGNNTQYAINWSDVGFGGAQPTRDLWAHQSLGTVAGWNGQINSHGVMMFRIGGKNQAALSFQSGPWLPTLADANSAIDERRNVG